MRTSTHTRHAQVDIVRQFEPPPPPPPRHAHNSPPPPGVVALLGFEGTDDGVTSQRAANNGTWTVSVPDARAAHTGGYGIYVEVSKAWRVASLARLLLPRCDHIRSLLQHVGMILYM